MIAWAAINAWWLVPAALSGGALAAFLGGFWPVVLAALGRLPPRVLALACALLAALVTGSGLYALGKRHGAAEVLAQQEAAEKRADEKATIVAKEATARTRKAVQAITERTEDAADEVDREMDAVDCPDVLPDRVRDQLGAAVERAREALPAD